MRIRIILVASVAALHAAPAMGQEAMRQEFIAERTPEPRTIKAFSLAERSIEMRAVTRRAQADTPLRRAQMEEAIEMHGVYPGYPQPALVTIDFRVQF